ncbi:MAG: class I SAM-dependent methyltransferase [Actinomycetota bacterium]|nr:class I SAM-dependent methyltransferase [Actinomycetota bacterium]
MHIDGSHQYEDVRTDAAFAKHALGRDGIVVFDDYRTGYTPGVGAAVWHEVADGLIPLCLSSQKFYGTWDPDSHISLAALIDAIGSDPSLQHVEIHTICGTEVAWIRDSPSQSRARRLAEAVTPPALRDAGMTVRRQWLSRRHAGASHRRPL